MKLSIIIPYANEWPLIPFTVMNIAEELRDRIDFEIITVDNSLPAKPDECACATDPPKCKLHRAYNQLNGVMRGHKWLKSLRYDDKLSHWQAKNLAVSESTGDVLWFCDAHCLVSRDALFNMFKYYEQHHEELNGTLHLPLTYQIMEYRKLIYKLVSDIPKGIAHYTFTSYRETKEPYKMPVMSTCGMMMSQDIYNQLGGWPTELGIYGGGENFINFTLAILGYDINIMPGHPLRHHGDKRGYSYNYDDYHRNRMIATYMYGGEDWVRRYQKSMKGKEEVKEKIANDVILTCKDHQDSVREKQVISIEDWIHKWTGGVL